MLMSRLQKNKQLRGLWRRRVVGCLMIGLLGVAVVSAAAAIPAQSALPRVVPSGASPKDETVFVNLGHDGAVREVYVVNTFRSPTGALLDYGAYSAVQNLSDEREIVLSDGRVEIGPGRREPAVFRYQGRLEQVALPWLFTVGYELDGESVTAEQLLGASGRLRISIHVRPNPDGTRLFADRFTLQAAVPLLVDKTEDVSAPGATSLLVGNRLILGFMVQTGESYRQIIEATVRDFALPRIEITAFLAGEMRGAWRDNLENSMGELTDGLSELVTGTARLRSGLSDLHAGVGEISNALTPLGDGVAQLDAALTEYAPSMEKFAAGLAVLQAADQELRQADRQMQNHLTAVQSGYTDIAAGLNALRNQGSSLRELATALLASPDPAVSQLAHAALLQLAALEQIEQGLSQANVGLADFAAGQNVLAQQKEAFSQGLAQTTGSSTALAQGAAELAASMGVMLDGVAALSEGVSAMHANTGVLPGHASQLVSGQRQMLSGVRDSRRDFGRLLGEGRSDEVRSFADPLRANARSVQFVFVIAPMEEERVTVNLPDPALTTTFAERVLELVRRVFSWRGLIFGRESAR